MLVTKENIDSHFLEILASYINPFILIIFIVFLIVFLMYLFSRYVLKPIEEKYIREKQEILLKNSKMMAMFAELDPDPVLRVNVNGQVIFFQFYLVPWYATMVIRFTICLLVLYLNISNIMHPHYYSIQLLNL
jgi:hypothetical protein